MNGTWKALRVAAILSALTLVTYACAKSDEPLSSSQAGTARTSVAVGSRYPAAQWDNLPEGKEWSSYANAAVDDFGSDLVTSVPTDVGEYCPRYSSASASERKAFWIGLLSALTKFESNYDPRVSFTESFNDAKGRPVVSRGLLQISIESGRGYGCRIPDEQSLHDPEANLTCAVRILNRLVPRDNVIGSNGSPWKGAAAYWSPFRNTTKRAKLRSWVKQQAYCQI